jgi:hypothetical protein
VLERPGNAAAMPRTRDHPATSLHSGSSDSSSVAGSGQSAPGARSPAQELQGHCSQAVLRAEKEASCHADQQRRPVPPDQQPQLARADGPVTPELIQLAQVRCVCGCGCHATLSLCASADARGSMCALGCVQSPGCCCCCPLPSLFADAGHAE